MATTEQQEFQPSTPDTPMDENGRANIDDTKHGKHIRTQSEQMLANMAVEEDVLRELKFAKLIVKCPCLLCIAIIVILLAISAIDAILFEFTPAGNRTYIPNPPDKYVDGTDAFTLARDLISFDDNETNTIVQADQDGWFMYQMFFTLSDYKGDFDENNPDKTDYWILTPEHIKTILKWEDEIVNDQEWQNQYCWVGDDPMRTNYSCNVNDEADPFAEQAAIISPARYVQDYFDAQGKGDSYTTEEVKALVMTNLIWSDPSTSLNLEYCFNPGVSTTNQTYIYRSFFKAGTPFGNGKFSYINGTRVHLSDYKNSEDRIDEEQDPAFLEWALVLYNEIMMDTDGELSDNGLDILVMSYICWNAVQEILLFGSFTFFFLAVAIVLVYMTFHLQSLFLALAAMFEILMSFPLAYLLYRAIFGIVYFDFLNTLIIFVLLGVGADDVFVFTDAWLQSVHFVGSEQVSDSEDKCCGYDRREDQRNIMRMSFTYRRAAKAMLVTQITTFFAFLATAISPLMPMSAFGIWAASIVAMNYVLVITLYPAILILHHKYIKNWEQKICCFCCKSCSNSSSSNLPKRTSVGDSPGITRQLSVEEQSEEYRKFERFLGVKWSRFVIKFRWYILIFFLGLLGVSIAGASQMTTAQEIDEFLFDDHPIIRAQAKLDEFEASDLDALVSLRIMLGISGVDRTGSKKYKPNENYGSIIWDDDFEMSSVEQQEYLLFMCNDIKSQSEDNGGTLVYTEDLVLCPIADFERYLNSNLSSPNDTFPYVYQGSDMTQDEAFTQKWIEFLFSGFDTTSLQYGLSYVDIEATPPKIRMYATFFQTPLSWISGGNQVESFLEDINDYIASLTDSSSDCPDNLCDSVYNVGDRWVWLSITNAFISSAIQGIVIAMPLAFIVMILSTQNWIIALFAVIDIVGVMATELAFMYINGWDFGLSESISIIIIIGFSVDYVVHLANAYLESSAESRNERLSFALLTMGISVVSGALTTFGAGFFLIFPPITYFVKMGYIMMSTVIVSIIWAMCFFTAICAALGPQGTQGDIKQYFKKCCCNKNKESNNDDNGDIEMQ